MHSSPNIKYWVNTIYAIAAKIIMIWSFCIWIQNSFSVPPEKLLISDENGAHIPHYTIGPYNEGSSVNVTCVSTGGKLFKQTFSFSFPLRYLHYAVGGVINNFPALRFYWAAMKAYWGTLNNMKLFLMDFCFSHSYAFLISFMFQSPKSSFIAGYRAICWLTKH